MLTLSTFGALAVRSESSTLKVPTKASVLLVLLCDSPVGTLERKRAQTLLWPDVSESRAQHSLDQTVYTLRRVCSSLVVDVDATYLRLRNGISADFRTFGQRCNG
jgi:DNA-binding SARP family transcriptional activator